MLFKVGDVVIGNEIANEFYSITKTGWIGTVQKVYNDPSFIEVKNETDGVFMVNSNCFNLYVDNAISEQTEKEFEELLF